MYPAAEREESALKDRVKSAIILVAVTAACMPWAITRILYFAVAGGLCAYEYSKNVEKLNARCTLWVMIVYLAAQAALAYFHMGLFLYVVCFVFCLYLALFSGVLHTKVSGVGALYTVAGMNYPCVLFGIIMVISVSEIWWQTLLTACLATWICDSAALFGGMRFGRHKLAPAVSPKKTIEGAICGSSRPSSRACSPGGSSVCPAVPFPARLPGDGVPRRLYGTDRGSGGIASQAHDRREGFLQSDPRPRRRVRPGRQPALLHPHGVSVLPRGGDLKAYQHAKSPASAGDFDFI